MGLLSALALTVVMALPSAVTYDELASYIDENNTPDEDEDMNVKIFAQAAVLGTCLLASCVVVVVVCLITMACVGGRYWEDREAFTNW